MRDIWNLNALHFRAGVEFGYLESLHDERAKLCYVDDIQDVRVEKLTRQIEDCTARKNKLESDANALADSVIAVIVGHNL